MPRGLNNSCLNFANFTFYCIDLMKVILLGTAHPYRGGLASYNECLARQFSEPAHGSLALRSQRTTAPMILYRPQGVKMGVFSCRGQSPRHPCTGPCSRVRSRARQGHQRSALGAPGHPSSTIVAIRSAWYRSPHPTPRRPIAEHGPLSWGCGTGVPRKNRPDSEQPRRRRESEA